MSVKVTHIRQAHRDLTRERILESAVELMAESMDTDIQLAPIAARAGVTERTIYRHFLSRDQLAQAVWPRVVARMQLRIRPGTAAELVRLPGEVFPDLDRTEGLVRAALYSAASRQAGLETNAVRQAAMLACADEALPKLNDAARRRRAAVLLTLCSAYGWAVLKDFGGLSGEDISLAASEALAVLLGLRGADDGAPMPEAADTPSRRAP